MKMHTWRPLLLGLSLALTIGCGGGSSGGPNSSDEDVGTDLIVQQVLPTNGQEVLTDLSDVNEEGEIVIKFSEAVAKASVLDENDDFTGLTSYVNILDSSFNRVEGEPTLDDSQPNVLRFKPAGGALPNGQYTVTVSRDVRSRFGAQLNNGLFDHRSSFTVGIDDHKPVIRSTFPVANQKGVKKESKIIVIFNESLAPATVNSGTFQVLDGGVAPPAPIPGTIALQRDNFEIVFTPDPTTLLPTNTTIVVQITGGPSGITDVVGNPFDTPTGPTFQFQFESEIVPPAPVVPPPVDPAIPDAAVYVGNATSVGVLGEFGYSGSGFADLTQWAVSAGGPNPIANSFRKVGRPGDMVVDQRADPTDFHSWVYIVDDNTGDVVIMGTRDCQIVHRWKNLPDATGLSNSGNTLYVSNRADNSVSVLDIGRVTPGAPVASDVVKALSSPPDRKDITVGAGPGGISIFWDQPYFLVANRNENSVTMVDTTNLTVFGTFPVGANPYEVATTITLTNNAFGLPMAFAFITNQGGVGDEFGSVSFYSTVDVFQRTLPFKTSIAAQIDGVYGPQGVTWDNGVSAWVASSEEDQIKKITIQFQGSGLGQTVLPAITSTVNVGRNPTAVAMEAILPALGGLGSGSFTAISVDRGSSQLTFVDNFQPSRPTFTLPIPGARSIATWFTR